MPGRAGSDHDRHLDPRRTGEVMSVVLAVRFPLGRYHATAWDRSVNEGAVEWPPSPWRLLRALVATWYTRWPQLAAPLLDDLLDRLGDPPQYWAASARPAHTRHYLPDADHKKGETGATDLTLDPYLSLPASGDHLLVRWDVELSGEQRGVLAKLAELVPYLGRGGHRDGPAASAVAPDSAPRVGTDHSGGSPSATDPAPGHDVGDICPNARRGRQRTTAAASCGRGYCGPVRRRAGGAAQGHPRRAPRRRGAPPDHPQT